MDLLLHGPVYTLAQNVVYALPAAKSTMFCDTTTPTLQLSNTSTFTNNVAITLVAGQATISGGFIRSTAGAASISLDRD